MNTLHDLQKFILTEYGIQPTEFNKKELRYRAITFSRNSGSAILANKETADMWTVKRDGHSIDFFRTDELISALSPSGSLLYFFMPINRLS